MPRKRPKLGQHFLHDPAVAHRIVDALEPDGKTVLEVGPGKGVLTYELAERAGRLVAVELDRRLAEELIGALAGPHTSIECGDILDRPLQAWITREAVEEFLLAGNLPYAITSPVLFACFEARPYLKRAVLMMQREVAQRLVVGPGSRTYGILSVIGSAYADIDLLFTVGRGAFKPPPAVTSAVVRVNIYAEPLHGIGAVDGPTEEWFRQVVRASFGQRRKMLRNSLKGGLSHLSMEKLDRGADEAGVDLTRRAESLSLEEFVRLARALPEPKPV
jgi:16S rRNA (adenine1518-N6/adenine1519-N6)-dimethyltransferase